MDETYSEVIDAGIGTTISNGILKCKLEVAEYKAKMEVASLNFEMQLQMQNNKFNSKRRSTGLP
jgi:hypothetical protein